MLIGVDGTPGQNVLVAAWLRSIMPEEAPRIIVTDDGLSQDLADAERYAETHDMSEFYDAGDE